jgi:exonuclease VII large subunit
MLGMIESIAPEYTSVMQQISGSLSKVGLLHRQFVSAESRSAEEFRDICERQSVVQRVSNEFTDAYNAFKQVTDALNESVTNKAKAQGRSLKPGKERSLNEAIQKCVNLKEQSSAFLAVKIKELIRQRERFVRFKERKIRTGFEIYAEHLRNFLENKVTVMADIEKLSLELRELQPVLPAVCRAYEDEFQSLLVTKPIAILPVGEEFGAEPVDLTAPIQKEEEEEQEEDGKTPGIEP